METLQTVLLVLQLLVSVSLIGLILIHLFFTQKTGGQAYNKTR